MKKYSKNYLKAVSKTYPPSGDNLKFIRAGEYMFTEDYKRELIFNLGDSGYILFDFFYSRKKYNYFVPTDNTYIANQLGWTDSKVERIKTLLVKEGYLLLLKDTVKDGSKFYRILLGKDIVDHYKKHGVIDDSLLILKEEVDNDIQII
jgi:hypothetical protein